MMQEEFIGLIPAAGKGVRLSLPYPKELYPVISNNHYKPISQFILSTMTEAGVKHIIFVINENKHQLIGYFGDGHRFDCHISYIAQEPANNQNNSTSPGLAYALDSAYHLIGGKTVFFGMADTIIQPTNVFKRAIETASPDDDVILICFKTNHPEKFGMVHTNQADEVKEIIDKPSKTDLTHMWGCMIWRSRFTEHLHESVNQKGISDFACILNSAIKKGLRFRQFIVDEGVYMDLGTYEEIVEFHQYFREE